MKIRQYQPNSDYELLEEWFKGWDWSMWDKDAISPFSYFIEQDGKPLVFTSYYRTIGTTMAQMGFTVSDPNISKDIRREALDILLDYVFKECEELGIKYLHYATDSKSMANTFRNKDARMISSDNVSICVKEFGGHKAEFLDE